MGFEFLNRVRKTTILSALVVSSIVWARAGLAPAAAFVLGCAWSLVNLHVLRLLVRLVVDDPKSHKLRIAAVLVVKVPVLYAAGFVMLYTGRLPAFGLLAGFVWPLSVIVLKAAGRLILRLDEPRKPAARARTSGVQRGC